MQNGVGHLMQKEISDLDFSRKQDFSGLLEQMRASGGFVAKNLGLAADILESMFKDKTCVRFISFPAAPVATGLRGLLADMARRRLFDIIVTTCGTFDHDLARAWGGRYLQGAFEMDDVQLRKRKVNRLGNVLVPDASYGLPLEKNMLPILAELLKKKEEWRPSELAAEFGARVKDKNSILYWATKNKIKVFSPGIFDGAFGTQLTFFATQNPRFKINEIDDQKELAQLGFKTKKTGALIIGGGISKHHTLWWNQFKGGLDYAVGITTAFEYDGSLSGARLREAVSWGKISQKARYVTVDGDATAILPVLMAAVYERLFT